MMAFLQALTFTTPAALAGLLLLPVIWWLLRFTPPKPQTVKFPPLRLLLELVSKHEQPDKTPWWLMLLRLAIAALCVLRSCPTPSTRRGKRQRETAHPS